MKKNLYKKKDKENIQPKYYLSFLMKLTGTEDYQNFVRHRILKFTTFIFYKFAIVMVSSSNSLKTPASLKTLA